MRMHRNAKLRCACQSPSAIGPFLQTYYSALKNSCRLIQPILFSIGFGPVAAAVWQAQRSLAFRCIRIKLTQVAGPSVFKYCSKTRDRNPMPQVAGLHVVKYCFIMLLAQISHFVLGALQCVYGITRAVPTFTRFISPMSSLFASYISFQRVAVP
jgi:hypothetical protein